MAARACVWCETSGVKWESSWALWDLGESLMGLVGVLVGGYGPHPHRVHGDL